MSYTSGFQPRGIREACERHAGELGARADENGEPLYVVQLIALTDGAAEILAVKVPGQPSAGIRQGHPVKVTGLVAQPWTMNDRAGVAFRATRVEPVVAQAKAS